MEFSFTGIGGPLANMTTIFIEEKEFEAIDFTKKPLKTGVYEYCTFKNCDFSKSDLANITFIESVFEGCNLSLVSLNNTILRDIDFRNSKIIGVRFDNCEDLLLSVSFSGCSLKHSSFYGINMRKTRFEKTNLQDVDFTECNLSAAVFDECDLHGAQFFNTILEKVDFRTSMNYSIDPEANKIKNGKFSMFGLVGLLGKYDIKIY
ncbi:pentapeptide repeat-containing protein [Desulfopila sp. IMCC35008]|uniref:pentapeptide repeat-containing protein n=1 Tax=Desulfopila sp. IMCC35008 TaxID=2653858 RepID=UPI00197B049E|nr:pentapeptide repeat-containing protein [Desulfopila sp. IMCC35008]